MKRALQLERLRRYLKHQVLPYSAFYRESFAKAGFSPDDIHEWDDLQSIPFTSKTDLISTPDNPRRVLDFALLPKPEELKRRADVIRHAILHGRKATQEMLEREYRPIFLTSTTGRSAEPVSFLYSNHDIANLTVAGRHLVDVFGTKPDDRVLNMFPFAPHLAFWQAHYATTASNLFCVSSGGGKVMGTEGNIRLLKKLRPTALIGMPTFLYHFLRQAVDEGVKCDTLTRLVLGGEKVPDGMKLKLRDLCAKLGSPNTVPLATYGLTEAKMAFAECPTTDGSSSGYHLYPDFVLTEIIDPDSGAHVPDGRRGEIVITHLDARGTVVIRYRTGDIIEGGITYERCPHCGRDWPRLVGEISRRTSNVELHLEKLKGTIVNFDTLEHVLDDFREIGTWQLELRKLHDDPLDIDELILHAEKADDETDEDLRRKINATFAANTELHLNRIEFHDPAEMRRLHGVGTELKEKRVVDHRPKK